MTGTKTLSIVIDPSGTETGGRVVKRVIEEVATSATKAERSLDSLSSKGSTAMRGVSSAAKDFGVSAREIEQATLAAQRSANSFGTALATVTRHAGLASFQQRNLAFQLNDVAVSLASGMNPLMVLIQQGSQIATIYGPGEGGIGRAFKETASMAVTLAARLWPVAAAAAGVYGAYKLISSYSVAARSDVDAMTRSMAEQAMSASSLKGAISEFASMRETLVSASEVSGALNNLISLQGSYGSAISNTAGIQTQVSSTIVENLRREFNAKRAVLEVEAKLQAAKIATMRADLAAARVGIEAEIRKSVNTRDDLEALGYSDPRVGRLTQLPDSVSGLEKLRSTLDELGNTPAFLAFKKAGADLAAAEVAAEQLAATLNTSFDDVQVTKGLDSLSKLAGTAFGPAIQGANSLSTAVGSVSTAAQTASNGVVNVTQSLASARMQTLAAMQQSSAQITTMKTELASIQSVLKSAADTPASAIFGSNLTGKAASDAIANAATSIEKVMTAMEKSGMAASTANESIELVRQSLKAMGGDSKAVDTFINAMVAGYMRTMELKGAIDQVSQSVMNIPNRIIDIGIRQYTVGAAGGGTKAVNVYGGASNYNYQSYDVGGGKSISVTSFGGGSQTGSVATQTQYDIGGKMITVHGTRAAGGPVEAGKRYLVGENGPELLTMGGAGMVANTNSTAAILSGGRDTLSLIEDHLYSALNELKVHTGYLATAESDTQTMIASLQAIKSDMGKLGASYARGGVSSSYSSGGSRGSFGSGGANQNGPVVNYGSIYSGIGIGSYNGTGAIGYDAYTIVPSKPFGGTGIPDLHKPAFATGGQIVPGEDQRVEFFKKNTERVIIVDDSKVSDGRGGGQQQARSERPIQITNHFHGDTRDARSRQAHADEIRRVVQQAVRS